MLPHGNRTKEYVIIFKKNFSREEFVNVLRSEKFYIPIRFIFERQGLDIGCNKEAEKKINKIINKFYN